MSNPRSRVFTVLLVTVSLVYVSVAPAVSAIIGTETAMELEERTERIARIHDVLARDNVRTMLTDLGVDPQLASQRVASLTDAELAVLEQRLDSLPAGGVGVVEVVGIVAIVLIVLEILGVTNVFTKL